MIKPENGDNIISRVCSNISKVYAFEYAGEYFKILTVGDKLKFVRCKGTNRTTVKNEITINKLIDTIKKIHYLKMITIVSDLKNII